jgi:hypothetical protein
MVPSTAIPGRSLPRLRVDLTDASDTQHGSVVMRD